MLIKSKLKPNQGLRDAAKRAGVKLWEIADALNMHDTYFSKIIRKELSEEEKSVILRAIKNISEGGK